MSITMLSVELKMYAAGGFNYMRFFWLRNALAFIFWKSHLFRNPRESICKMQSAFSNYLLLKDRTTLEGYRSELKTWFCMKSDDCLLTHCPRKSKFLSETFPPPYSRVIKPDVIQYVLSCPTVRTQEFYN